MYLLLFLFGFSQTSSIWRKPVKSELTGDARGRQKRNITSTARGKKGGRELPGMTAEEEATLARSRWVLGE